MRLSFLLFPALLTIAMGAAHAADAPKPTDADSTQQRMHAAQERLEQAARELAELYSSKAGAYHMPDPMVFLGHNPNRAMLGIVIDSSHGESEEGVHVASVSPGGPAANGGLKAGDVIVELNGKALKGEKDNSSHDKLMAEMGKLSPGDEITLRYTRDGKSTTAKIKVDRLPHETVAREFRFRVDPDEHGHGLLGGDHDMVMRNFLGMRGGAFSDMELAPLTSKLGQYFGADKGLLVVHAPDKDSKLEDGDVLIDIDGRVPTNPGHAFRILDSYQPGEKLTLNILRQRKKMALSVTVPERNERGPRPPQPPHPAIAPVPPTAPTPATPQST